MYTVYIISMHYVYVSIYICSIFTLYIVIYIHIHNIVIELYDIYICIYHLHGSMSNSAPEVSVRAARPFLNWFDAPAAQRQKLGGGLQVDGWQPR